MSGFGLIGICGLSGFAQWIFKKDKKIEADERDIMIQKKAALAGYGACYGYLCLACMIPWFMLGPKETISINTLPQILIGGFIITVIVQSLATIIGYGGTDKNE